MKYPYYNTPVPQVKRKEFNEKILYAVKQEKIKEYALTATDIYNLYTGDGGLHGLQYADFDNYAAYSAAKKEIENGQFFTPAPICRLVAESLSPSDDAWIADLTCGAGGFFNFMPTEQHLYGCEIDAKAYTIAHYLYPKAHIEQKDIRNYRPPVHFDYVVGNPPYHLRWETEDENAIYSQLYYCIKASECLKPFGILALITPTSFLADRFSDGSQVREMEERFLYLGQVALPPSAFSTMGATQFPTKLQFWQKRSISSAPISYRTEMDRTLEVGFDIESTSRWIAKHILASAKHRLVDNAYQIFRELALEEQLSAHFQYQTEKMLYQIRCHPKLQPDYPKCLEYLHRFYTETQPPDMPHEEWLRKRLTEDKVLAYLKRTLKKQNRKPPEDRIALVKRDYDLVYKGYSHKARQTLTEEMKTPVPLYELASTDGTADYAPYTKLIQRKQREYAIQNQPFAYMREDPGIAQWLNKFQLWDAVNEEYIHLNPIQVQDMNRILQKRYGLLQWEQGSGKTLAGIASALYRMECENIHHTWVVSTAISIRNNWAVVLPIYGLRFVFVERLADLEKIRKGDFVIITLNRLSQYRKQIKKWVRIHNQKIHLVFDESDEMTNPSSVRAKTVLDCFRRCRSKLLTTGTSTRNNISEFVPQLELLYNNSANMLSWCSTVYKYSKDDGLEYHSNPYFGRPIPAYKAGYRLFSASHLPEKITVFGVGQRTQDIYNAEVLSEILDKTIITRTFEEVSGKDIKRIHQVPLLFTAPEREVYEIAMREFHKMRERYFASTGNSRKDSMMKLIQQITLMLRISAAPNTVQEYTGDIPVKLRQTVQLIKEHPQETVAICVRHKVVLSAYERVLREAFPDRPLFIVTGSTTTFAQRRKLHRTLKESGNGILLCTQQSLPSSVNFEFVNTVIIPELHYNNARMSQFYMRFIRYTSTEWKDIYFLTYAGSIESNLMQMVLAKEKINLFMKGQDTDLDTIYDKFGVDYDLLSTLMYREQDEKGNFHIRWGKQQIA